MLGRFRRHSLFSSSSPPPAATAPDSAPIVTSTLTAYTASAPAPPRDDVLARSEQREQQRGQSTKREQQQATAVRREHRGERVWMANRMFGRTDEGCGGAGDGASSDESFPATSVSRVVRPLSLSLSLARACWSSMESAGHPPFAALPWRCTCSIVPLLTRGCSMPT